MSRLHLQRLVCGLAAVLVAACSVPQIRATPGAPTVQLDPQRLVVVTVVNRGVVGLRGAGSTFRGYVAGSYSVAADAQGTVSELAADYALKPVDAWPIALLGVHCVVFEIAPGDTREDVLRRISADRRVESAQALQQFGTAASGGSAAWIFRIRNWPAAWYSTSTSWDVWMAGSRTIATAPRWRV